MKIFDKQDRNFAVFMTGMLVLFFADMIFAGRGFYHGDYIRQYLPWAGEISRSLKSLSLPLWTDSIGSGFPLLAEGQGAALHPLRWLLFFFLPFPVAYPVSFLVLFGAAGFSAFRLGRILGLSGAASSLIALGYLFGTPYAGIFYGASALWVLAWFPLSLVLAERLIQRPNTQNTILLGMSFALQWLGGFPQFAVYAIGYVLLYGLLRMCSSGTEFVCRMNAARGLAASAVLGVLLSLAQLLPTAELVLQSSRSGTGLDFALQQSMNPFGVLTAVWPGFGAFLRFDFYAGILTLVLAGFALVHRPRDPLVRVFAILTVVFLALAIGKYNPLYVLFLKATHLTFFRVPAKFSFFAIFSVCVLGASGLQILLESWPDKAALFRRWVTGVFAGAALIFGSAWIAARGLQDQIIAFADNYVRQYVFGQAGHPYSLENYLARLPDFLQLVLERTRITNVHTLEILSVWGLLFVFLFGFRPEKRPRRFLIAGLGLVLVLDLFLYSFVGTGFRGNRIASDAAAPDRITEYVSGQEGVFRTFEAVTHPTDGAPRLQANTNMIFGYESAGLYSPLAGERYREYLRDIGSVDDATGAYMTTPDLIEKNLSLLNLLNVRYLVIRGARVLRGLERILVSESGDVLYENLNVLPRYFITEAGLDRVHRTARLDPDEAAFLKKGTVLLVSKSATRLRLSAQTDQPGFLFHSRIHYPGWQARLDGKRVPLYEVNGVFQGIEIPAGEHTVEFIYRPVPFYWGVFLSLLSLAASIVLLCFQDKRSNGPLRPGVHAAQKAGLHS